MIHNWYTDEPLVILLSQECQFMILKSLAVQSSSCKTTHSRTNSPSGRTVSDSLHWLGSLVASASMERAATFHSANYKWEAAARQTTADGDSSGSPANRRARQQVGAARFAAGLGFTSMVPRGAQTPPARLTPTVGKRVSLRQRS